ncbi:hypothetical protein TcasGA2_TC011532 [Tribolium castaneum]|uniref:Uncharacterized protein n=1 Tax=Tribolium castaneum TaxID=7070 RepID=D6W6B2_TRICA|nr:PREDICTED: uncharacterized protein LOC103314879 isoform X1 [Tribolium castaneum]XP_015833204.1 PREDICTED: uncharacterized protein LOC103314879 isoform X1 [Tribolium castaneum]EFA11373.1 hypothetical protein TcasGA2_TC011532 [Tribolium castaneum]|eukprot:XP_015833203.1 PREDICTED: uncharacterized protein LOC103314879 isoform X1 [Tribolium castaneum]
MHQRAFLGGGWARGGASEVVRRAHPASGAQWNVQVVRGKVNGKCLWNACKALSLGLLLMVLGAAMATIGYYADHLSIAQEVRGNHTVRVKNESRGFHLNNLSYAGPIIMGVGGFIVVAACVMTFEARDSAAKVVPARLKLSTNGPPSGSYSGYAGHTHGGYSGHGSLRTSGSQTGSVHQQASHSHARSGATDRRALTESFLNFSRGLSLKSQRTSSLKIPQGSINKSPSAPNLVLEHPVDSHTRSSPVFSRYGTEKANSKSSRRTFANCALLNPSLLHRHALSVDETAANYRLSHESLQGSGSQGSLALDLHLECPVTLRIRDKRRNPLIRQRRVDEDERQGYDDSSRRSSHSCSPRIPMHIKDMKSGGSGGSTHQLPVYVPYTISRRRSSNASDSTHRSRAKRREYPHSRGKLERAISSDSRLMGAIPRTHRHYSPTQGSSIEQEPGGSSSDTDIRKAHVVHFCH